MKKLIVGNWKMNPPTFKQAEMLTRAVLSSAKQLKHVDTVLCPPFVWLTRLASAYGRHIAFGGQDVFWEEEGAFTGAISPKMLKSARVRYAIVGHSERRRYFGETDEIINKKVIAAVRGGLNVVLCVGESLGEKKAGATKQVLRRALRIDLKSVKRYLHRSVHLAIAYEPIWAIGTGIPETPFSANEAAIAIRKELSALLPNAVAQSVSILYGGSVSPQNIFGYLVMPEITGALVGGASLDADTFARILHIAELLA